MFSRVEYGQAWLEHITYQMTKMSYAEQNTLLAGQIGLLKAQLTRSLHHIADHAVQVRPALPNLL
jgi:predicted transcriptional regulator